MKKKASHAEWIEAAQARPSRCYMCRDQARPVLQEVLSAINEAKAFSVSVQKIYDRVAELSAGFSGRVRYDAFRHHLDSHEPLWHRAKVKA